MQSVHPQLQLNQSQCAEVMVKIASLRAHAWKRSLTAEETADFSARMARRYRTMAKHICATLAKHPKTIWLSKIFDDTSSPASSSKRGPPDTLVQGQELRRDLEADQETDQDEGGEADLAVCEGEESEPDDEPEDPEEENHDGQDEPEHDFPEEQLPPPPAPSKVAAKTKAKATAKAKSQPRGPSNDDDDEVPAGQEQYFYGWDFELKRAWRSPADGGPKAMKEFAQKLDVSGKYPMAFFRGSDVGVLIKAITTAEIHEEQSVAVNSGASKSIWNGTSPTGLKLQVARFAGLANCIPSRCVAIGCLFSFFVFCVFCFCFLCFLFFCLPMATQHHEGIQDAYL